MENEISEYVIYLTINKDNGFIPVARASKMIEELGGTHKYSSLLEVKDGDREYTINALMTGEIIQELDSWLDTMPDILQHSYIVL